MKTTAENKHNQTNKSLSFEKYFGKQNNGLKLKRKNRIHADLVSQKGEWSLLSTTFAPVFSEKHGAVFKY